MSIFHNPLKERFTFTPDSFTLEEGDGANKRLRVTGKIQSTEPNRNKRIYCEELWNRVLAEGSSFMERLKNREVVGQLEHPETGESNMMLTSHVVEKVWKAGKDIFGTFLILNTDAGKVVREYIEAKIPLKVSSRGDGLVEKTSEGYDKVIPDKFELDTWDFVSNQSVPGAVVGLAESINKNIRRNIMDLKESAMIVTKADSLYESTASKLKSKLDNKEALNIYEEIINTINSLATVDASMITEASECKGKLMTLIPQVKSTLSESAPQAPVVLLEKVGKEPEGSHAKVVSVVKNIVKENSSIRGKLIEMSKKRTPVVESTDKKIASKYQMSLKVIEELIGRVKSVGKADPKMTEKYSLSTDVIAELVERYKKLFKVSEKYDISKAIAGELVERYKFLEAKYKTSLEVSEGLVERYNALKTESDQVLEKARKLAVFKWVHENLDDKSIREAKDALLKCNSITEAKKLLGSQNIMERVNSVTSDIPYLPPKNSEPVKGEGLNESVKHNDHPLLQKIAERF